MDNFKNSVCLELIVCYTKFKTSDKFKTIKILGGSGGLGGAGCSDMGIIG